MRPKSRLRAFECVPNRISWFILMRGEVTRAESDTSAVSSGLSIRSHWRSGYVPWFLSWWRMFEVKETFIHTSKSYAFLNLSYLSRSLFALQNMAFLNNWQTAYVVTSTYSSKIKVKLNKKGRESKTLLISKWLYLTKVYTYYVPKIPCTLHTKSISKPRHVY